MGDFGVGTKHTSETVQEAARAACEDVSFNIPLCINAQTAAFEYIKATVGSNVFDSGYTYFSSSSYGIPGGHLTPESIHVAGRPTLSAWQKGEFCERATALDTANDSSFSVWAPEMGPLLSKVPNSPTGLLAFYIPHVVNSHKKDSIRMDSGMKASLGVAADWTKYPGDDEQFAAAEVFFKAYAPTDRSYHAEEAIRYMMEHSTDDKQMGQLLLAGYYMQLAMKAPAAPAAKATAPVAAATTPPAANAADGKRWTADKLELFKLSYRAEKDGASYKALRTELVGMIGADSVTRYELYPKIAAKDLSAEDKAKVKVIEDKILGGAASAGIQAAPAPAVPQDPMAQARAALKASGVAMSSDPIRRRLGMYVERLLDIKENKPRVDAFRREFTQLVGAQSKDGEFTVYERVDGAMLEVSSVKAKGAWLCQADDGGKFDAIVQNDKYTVLQGGAIVRDATPQEKELIDRLIAAAKKPKPAAAPAQPVAAAQPATPVSTPITAGAATTTVTPKDTTPVKRPAAPTTAADTKPAVKRDAPAKRSAAPGKIDCSGLQPESRASLGDLCK